MNWLFPDKIIIFFYLKLSDATMNGTIDQKHGYDNPAMEAESNSNHIPMKATEDTSEKEENGDKKKEKTEMVGPLEVVSKEHIIVIA